MSRTYQQAKQPGNTLIRPAPQQTLGRSPATRALQSAQSAYGNQAVNRLLDAQSVQAKMEVTPPSDSYEQEAEHVADQVTRMSDPAPLSGGAAQISRLPESISRAAKTESKDDKKKPDAGGGKKKEDDKVKRAEDKKDDKKKPEDELIKRAAKDDKKKDDKKQDSKKKEDDKVKRAAESDMKEDDEEKVQRAAAAAESVPDVTPEIERGIHAQRSSGQPLPDSMRSYFEPRFGKDLSNVRLHTDSRAADTASKLKAQAFTHGQDIYFAGGKYQPMSDSGKHLLAHEITHTVQQSGGRPAPSSGPLVSRGTEPGLVQRKDVDPSKTAGKGGESGLRKGNTITFDDIGVPGFKLSNEKGRKGQGYAKQLKRMKNYDRDRQEPDQIKVWKPELEKDVGPTKDKLLEKAKKPVAADKDSAPPPTVSDTYILKAPGKREYQGTLDTIAKSIVIPRWGKDGKARDYAVDHIVELQLANWEEDTWGNQVENMELLEGKVNSRSGGNISQSTRTKAQKYVDTAKDEEAKSVADVKRDFYMVFGKGTAGKGDSSVGEEMYWPSESIRKGEHVVEALEVLNASKSGDDAKVFANPAGGAAKTFPKTGGTSDWPKPFNTLEAKFATEPGDVSSTNFGTLKIGIPEDHPHFKPFETTLTLTRVAGAQYAGSLDEGTLLSQLGKLEHKKASPVKINRVDVDPVVGLTASGAIQPDLPLFEGKKIGFQMTGNDLTIDVEFGMGELNVPKPFIVKGSTIRVYAGTGVGLGADGQVDFAIEKVGEGNLRVGIGTKEGLSAAGEFNFDSKLFDQAKVSLSYEDKIFKATGDLVIGSNKVTGIKSAKAKGSYEAGTFKANGTADLTIPGVKKGDLTIEYSVAGGLKIGGDFTLGDIPGISSGNAKVSVEQGEAGYKLKADITAQPKIPGFSTELTGTYDDGAINISGSATYARGLMNGTLKLGATNQGIDAEGNPSGKAHGDKFVAYGSGEVTLKLTSWLQVKSGIKVLPNAEVELHGEVGLPSTVKLFEKMPVKESILDVKAPPIPVLGPIIVQFGGALDFEASFGPGELRDLSLSVTYNPSHEEDATVKGKGNFVIPADAGLNLSVYGGVGASVVVASLTGGIKVTGGMGIHAEAGVEADVNWSKRSGVEIFGKAFASAQPTFKFALNGYVNAEVGAGPLSYTIYHQEWPGITKEVGSDLKFEVALPVHYVEGKPFDVKFKDLEVNKPSVSVDQILHDLVGIGGDK